jgi:hypothetical protein
MKKRNRFLSPLPPFLLFIQNSKFIKNKKKVQKQRPHLKKQKEAKHTVL